MASACDHRRPGAATERSCRKCVRVQARYADRQAAGERARVFRPDYHRCQTTLAGRTASGNDTPLAPDDRLQLYPGLLEAAEQHDSDEQRDIRFVVDAIDVEAEYAKKVTSVAPEVGKFDNVLAIHDVPTSAHFSLNVLSQFPIVDT